MKKLLLVAFFAVGPPVPGPRVLRQIRKNGPPGDEGRENMGAKQTILGTPQTRPIADELIRSILSITSNTTSL
jgi:hypothetical protein